MKTLDIAIYSNFKYLTKSIANINEIIHELYKIKYYLYEKQKINTITF